MKRGKEATQNLSGFLGRFFSPSMDQIESASERVRQRLQAEACATPESGSVRGDAIRLQQGFRYFALAVSAVAVMVVVVLAASLLRFNNARPGTPNSNNSPNLMTLADGSRVEIRPNSEMSVEKAPDGLRIRLTAGSIIVRAAKQAVGHHLYVQTRDVTVSVIGTVFMVKANDQGSHVAVIEGEVRVQQAAVETSLLPGDQMSTNSKLVALALQDEIGWSPEAASYLALLHQSLAQSLTARQAPPRTSSLPGKPQFEEASIRICERDFQTPEGMRGGGSNSFRISPGRLDAFCMTPATLIRTAYGQLTNNQVIPGFRQPALSFNATYGLGQENGTRVRGGPDWVRDDHYTITAVAGGKVDNETLQGPMLMALLEKRFQLKSHIATEQIPVLALTVGKDGLKIKPTNPPSCATPPAPSAGEKEQREFEEEQKTKPMCRIDVQRDGSRIKMTLPRYSLQMLADDLSRRARPNRTPNNAAFAVLNGSLVVDKTGIPNTDTFDFVLEFGAETDNAANPPTPSGPTISEALEKLGLKLEPSKGSREYVVIDQIEKPSPN
jgi:uncharacterized protein (TIGR03435 family)